MFKFHTNTIGLKAFGVEQYKLQFQFKIKAIKNESFSFALQTQIYFILLQCTES